MNTDDKESHDIIVSDVAPPSTPDTEHPSAPVSPSAPVPWPPKSAAAGIHTGWLCACGGCWALYRLT